MMLSDYLNFAKIHPIFRSKPKFFIVKRVSNQADNIG